MSVADEGPRHEDITYQLLRRGKVVIDKGVINSGVVGGGVCVQNSGLRFSKRSPMLGVLRMKHWGILQPAKGKNTAGHRRARVSLACEGFGHSFFVVVSKFISCPKFAQLGLIGCWILLLAFCVRGQSWRPICCKEAMFAIALLASCKAPVEFCIRRFIDGVEMQLFLPCLPSFLCFLSN